MRGGPPLRVLDDEPHTITAVTTHRPPVEGLRPFLRRLRVSRRGFLSWSFWEGLGTIFRNFSHFFAFFSHFGSFLSHHGIFFKIFFDFFDFLSILDGFGEDFGRVLEGFFDVFSICS